MGLTERTENTITNRSELFGELEEIRRRRYAFNDEESIEDLRSVGVPIVTQDGGVLGALSVSGPTHRLSGEWYREEIPNVLPGATNEIELNIAYG